MRDFVAWTGPVNLTQVPGATVPAYDTSPAEKSFGCTGDGSTNPSCNDLAETLRAAGGGSILRGMSRIAQLGESEVRDCFVGAFSAGGGVQRRMLEIQEDQERVRAVMMSDATYSSAWKDKSARIPIVQQCLIDFGVRVARGRGDQLWVATASPSPNYTLATGVEVLRELRAQIEAKSGMTFERLNHFYGVSPAPESAWRLGTIVFAEYPLSPLGHGHTKIAGQVWQKILHPWLAELRGAQPEPVPPPSPYPYPTPNPPPEPPPEPAQTPPSPLLSGISNRKWVFFGSGVLVGYLAAKGMR